MNFEELNKEYDKLQKIYGDPNLHSVYNGGYRENPDICFVFMNPTGKNISSDFSWEGPHYPWLGTKNIWDLFLSISLLDQQIYDKIKARKGSEWTIDFCEEVYDNIKKHKIFITNLGKCTQIDARPLPDNYYKEYLPLLEREIALLKPKIVITLGNQVSSILLGKNISVSKCRKEYFEKEIENICYKIFPVYYPIGNGRFNINKAIEDINYIIANFVKENSAK